MEQKEDRRVLKTRTLLFEALIDLMIEKGYESITVQDIIDRANVGRSTFYFHFEDKEQLLKASIKELRKFIIQQKSQHPVTSDSTEKLRFYFSLAMLQHVQSHKRIYMATVGKERGGIILYHMRQMLYELVRDEMESVLISTDNVPIPREVAIDFVLSTFFTLITWWMNQQSACSAKEVDQMFHRLVLKGIGVKNPSTSCGS